MEGAEAAEVAVVEGREETVEAGRAGDEEAEVEEVDGAAIAGGAACSSSCANILSCFIIASSLAAPPLLPLPALVGSVSIEASAFMNSATRASFMSGAVVGVEVAEEEVDGDDTESEANSASRLGGAEEAGREEVLVAEVVGRLVVESGEDDDNGGGCFSSFLSNSSSALSRMLSMSDMVKCGRGGRADQHRKQWVSERRARLQEG